ncbi:MAG: hypothetical protein KQI78_12285 [Deltaproteobacteria bacterium]|nr:hypothetical protein [Deltaproteobacteria bacterium]
MRAKAVLLALLLCLVPSVLLAVEGTGLETGGNKNISFLVEGLSDDTRKVGLTKDLIKAKVELQLRKNGLKGSDDADLNGFLYVNVNAIEGAYSIIILYKRPVTYTVGSESFDVVGDVWSKSSVGNHGGSSDFIIKWVLRYIDVFSAEYLKANGL